ncbi:MAG: hypothetical protein BWY59_01708 [Verrucomicrobia bacterium ADurb.Bin345]|nr:MAG: hypothetical protein BWY59_01708 [Verrucomicrobia bacterium ADurb.Bin345]
MRASPTFGASDSASAIAPVSAWPYISFLPLVSITAGRRQFERAVCTNVSPIESREGFRSL